MNQIAAIALFTVTTLYGASAETSVLVPDPEVDFINTPDSVRAEWGILKNDELVRLDLDIDGTNKPAVFLASKGSGSKCGPSWTAYFPIDGKGYRRSDGVQFREDFIRAGKVQGLTDEGGLLALYPGKGGGNLVRFRFFGGTAQFDEVRALDYSKPEDRQLFESIFQRKLGESMGADFFKNPPHKVIAVKDIMARSQASPQQAAPPEQAPSSTQAKPPPAVPPSPTSNAFEGNSTHASVKQLVSTPWLVWSVAILAAIGLLWLLLKKRRGSG